MRAGGKRRGSRTLGLVLSGGGARGAFQVGVYERLLSDARFADGPAVISGTSAGGINAALIAGEVEIAVVPLATAVPLIQEGRIRALAVTGARRSAAVPDVPTVAEAALPGFDSSGWQGWFISLSATRPELPSDACCFHVQPWLLPSTHLDETIGHFRLLHLGQ